MSTPDPQAEPVLVEGRIKIPYRWPAGRAGGTFLVALRDEGRLLGLRCPACRRVLVPPRGRCPFCKAACEQWVPVGPGGGVETWTRRGETLLALVRLDGADTALLHLLVDCAAPESGMRVRAVLEASRTGHIRDLVGFAPEEAGTASAEEPPE